MNPIEQLRKAIEVEGVNPRYHHELMGKHRYEWPVLWDAIDRLLGDRRMRTLGEIYSFDAKATIDAELLRSESRSDLLRSIYSDARVPTDLRVKIGLSLGFLGIGATEEDLPTPVVEVEPGSKVLVWCEVREVLGSEYVLQAIGADDFFYVDRGFVGCSTADDAEALWKSILGDED